MRTNNPKLTSVFFIVAATALAGCSSRGALPTLSGQTPSLSVASAEVIEAPSLAAAGVPMLVPPSQTAKSSSAITSPVFNRQATILSTDNSDRKVSAEGHYEPIVYFDFDSFSVKPEYREMLIAYAQYMRNSADEKFVVVGHTDDIGGIEYNLALGQRRAEEVRRILVMMGVPDNVVSAISMGELQPLSDSQRQLNRRAEITK